MKLEKFRGIWMKLDEIEKFGGISRVITTFPRFFGCPCDWAVRR